MRWQISAVVRFSTASWHIVGCIYHAAVNRNVCALGGEPQVLEQHTNLSLLHSGALEAICGTAVQKMKLGSRGLVNVVNDYEAELHFFVLRVWSPLSRDEHTNFFL